jgi:hypothetical protein
MPSGTFGQTSIVGRTRNIEGTTCHGDSDIFAKLLGCDPSFFSSTVGLVLASSSPKTFLNLDDQCRLASSFGQAISIASKADHFSG